VCSNHTPRDEKSCFQTAIGAGLVSFLTKSAWVKCAWESFCQTSMWTPLSAIISGLCFLASPKRAGPLMDFMLFSQQMHSSLVLTSQASMRSRC
jgi:hypothetical protein